MCDAHGPSLPNDSKHNEASFSTISTDMLHLQVAQMPRSPYLAIFVLTTTIAITLPIAHAQHAQGGNYLISWPNGRDVMTGIIGASRSEPHTSDVNRDFPFVYIQSSL